MKHPITIEFCSTCKEFDGGHLSNCPRVTDPLQVPLCHMNGTSRRDLAEAYEMARNAIDKAIRAMYDTAPNGRDYYPLGGNATATAIRQHVSRLERLEGVKAELTDIYGAIVAQ